MPYHVYPLILDHLIMNKDEYQEIYNYLKALHIPKDYDEQRITHLKNKSNKYFIQHHQLFRIVGPKQIYRTSRTFTVTTVGDLTLDEINAIEEMFNVYPEEINEFEDFND